MKKIIFVFVLMLVLGCSTPSPLDTALSEPSSDSVSKSAEDDLIFIIANPLDLSQIQRISVFRSCVGHDYSGLNSAGEEETLRSMKHYLEPLPSLIGTNQIKIFAPFDGKVVEILDGLPGQAIYISAMAAPSWKFIFFHVVPAAGIEEGTVVQAGELVGAVSEGIHENFDFGLKEFGWKGQVFDSPLLHMKETVLQEYVDNGITLGNSIFSKEARDAAPCPVEGSRNGDALFTGYRDEDFVTLRSDLTQEVEKDATEPAANSAPLKSVSPPDDNNRALFPGGTVLHRQDGVTFEHYFPNTGSLKSDESEILIYNERNIAVQVVSSDMKFILGGKTYEQYSGTWEKFPSKQSWERMEQVNIKPLYYQGQPLILEPGQKGKLHWHYQFGGDISGKEQAVEINVAYKIGSQSYTLERRVVREENNGNSGGGEIEHTE